jgi:TonB-dependent receptor
MGGSWQNRNALTRFVGANYHFLHNSWTIDLAATYSNSSNKVRDTAKGFFNAMGTSLIPFTTATKSTYTGGSLNIDGFDNGTMNVGSVAAYNAAGNAIDTTQLANYAMGQVQSLPATNYDSVTEYRADIRRAFDLPWFPLSIQVGGATNNLVRDLEYSSIYYTYVGPDGVANSGDESMAAMVDTSYAGTSPGFGLPGYQWASPWVAYDILQSHPNYYVQTPGNLGDQVKNEATRSPLLKERVSGAYAMADIKLLRNRLRIVGGVRYELTQDSGFGYRQDGNAIYVKDASGNPVPVYNSKGVVTGYQLLPELVGKSSSGPEYNSLIYKKRASYNARNYHDYFPSAAAVFNITDNFLLRFAFAKTTGRPSPSDIVPNSYVGSNATYDPNTSGTYPGWITSSNTSLVPWTAKNYDLSLEYYLPHNGVVSAGVFRKDIRNFFGNLSKVADVALLDSLDLSHDYVGYQWSTRINVGDARIDGLELGYNQNLDFIPSVGRYFDFYANVTKLRILGQYATQFTLKTGAGNIPMTGNAGLAFSNGRLSAHVGWNYRGKQFRDTASQYPNARENVLAYQTWDADVQYRLTTHFAIFLAGRNINNCINRWSLEGPDAPGWAMVENRYTNGAQYSLGVKGSF